MIAIDGAANITMFYFFLVNYCLYIMNYCTHQIKFWLTNLIIFVESKIPRTLK